MLRRIGMVCLQCLIVLLQGIAEILARWVEILRALGDTSVAPSPPSLAWKVDGTEKSLSPRVPVEPRATVIKNESPNRSGNARAVPQAPPSPPSHWLKDVARIAAQSRPEDQTSSLNKVVPKQPDQGLPHDPPILPSPHVNPDIRDDVPQMDSDHPRSAVEQEDQRLCESSESEPRDNHAPSPTLVDSNDGTAAPVRTGQFTPFRPRAVLTASHAPRSLHSLEITHDCAAGPAPSPLRDLSRLPAAKPMASARRADTSVAGLGSDDCGTTALDGQKVRSHRQLRIQPGVADQVLQRQTAGPCNEAPRRVATSPSLSCSSFSSTGDGGSRPTLETGIQRAVLLSEVEGINKIEPDVEAFKFSLQSTRQPPMSVASKFERDVITTVEHDTFGVFTNKTRDLTLVEKRNVTVASSEIGVEVGQADVDREGTPISADRVPLPAYIHTRGTPTEVPTTKFERPRWPEISLATPTRSERFLVRKMSRGLHRSAIRLIRLDRQQRGG